MTSIKQPNGKMAIKHLLAQRDQCCQRSCADIDGLMSARVCVCLSVFGLRVQFVCLCMLNLAQLSLHDKQLL